jgi:hypothetical protein
LAGWILVALANVDELLEALAQRDTWSRLADEAELASLAWLNCVKRCREWQQKIFETPGVDGLTLICRASGRKLDHDWLAEQHAKSTLAGHKVSEMSVGDFADLLSGKKPKAAGRGRKETQPVTKAKRLIKKGHARQTIADQTGLSVKHISTLKSQMKGKPQA